MSTKIIFGCPKVWSVSPVNHTKQWCKGVHYMSVFSSVTDHTPSLHYHVCSDLSDRTKTSLLNWKPTSPHSLAENHSSNWLHNKLLSWLIRHYTVHIHAKPFSLNKSGPESHSCAFSSLVLGGLAVLKRISLVSSAPLLLSYQEIELIFIMTPRLSNVKHFMF